MSKKFILFAMFILTALAMPAISQEPSQGEIVSFPAEDGTELSGVWRGTSDHLVILSHQAGITQDGWALLVARLENEGYSTLTYNFRGHPPSGGVLNTDLAARDLRGAVAYAYSRGAAHLTLIGASMGGIATVAVAPEADPDAYIIVASSRIFGTLQATDEALKATSAPKLFVTGDRDTPSRDMRHMAETASGVSTLSLYPTSFHALLLFKTPHAEPLIEEIATFVKQHMPLAQ